MKSHRWPRLAFPPPRRGCQDAVKSWWSYSYPLVLLTNPLGLLASLAIAVVILRPHEWHRGNIRTDYMWFNTLYPIHFNTPSETVSMNNNQRTTEKQILAFAETIMPDLRITISWEISIQLMFLVCHSSCKTIFFIISCHNNSVWTSTCKNSDDQPFQQVT